MFAGWATMIECHADVATMQEMGLKQQVAHVLGHHKALEVLMSRLAAVSQVPMQLRAGNLTAHNTLLGCAFANLHLFIGLLPDCVRMLHVIVSVSVFCSWGSWRLCFCFAFCSKHLLVHLPLLNENHYTTTLALQDLPFLLCHAFGSYVEVEATEQDPSTRGLLWTMQQVGNVVVTTSPGTLPFSGRCTSHWTIHKLPLHVLS
jgi:hypothetical protein